MKYIAMCIAYLGFLFFMFMSSEARCKEHIVRMKKMSFVPKDLAVQVSDTIKFINVSKNIHNVVIPDLDIKTKMIKRGHFVIITIKEEGDFDYYCQPHRTMGMTGNIEAEEKEVNGTMARMDKP